MNELMKTSDVNWGGESPTPQDFTKGKVIIGIKEDDVYCGIRLSIHTIEQVLVYEDKITIATEVGHHHLLKDYCNNNSVLFLGKELNKAKEYLKNKINERLKEGLIYTYYEPGPERDSRGAWITGRKDPSHTFQFDDIKALKLNEQGVLKPYSLKHINTKEQDYIMDTRDKNNVEYIELLRKIDNMTLETLVKPKIGLVKLTVIITLITMAIIAAIS